MNIIDAEVVDADLSSDDSDFDEQLWVQILYLLIISKCSICIFC